MDISGDLLFVLCASRKHSMAFLVADSCWCLIKSSSHMRATESFLNAQVRLFADSIAINGLSNNISAVASVSLFN